MDPLGRRGPGWSRLEHPRVTQRDDGPSPTERRACVCIVDDDDSIRQALARLLRVAGYEVLTFGGGREFLSFAERERAECVVLDVRMPGIDGLEVQRRLAGSQAGRALVFISGHDDPAARSEALANGARAFFSKPFDEETFLSAVADTVGHDAHGP